MKKIIFILVISFILTSCFTAPKPPKEQDFGTGTCSLEQLEWNSVTEGFDQERTVKILSDFEAAIGLNQSKIISDGKLKADFSTAFNNIIKAANKKEFKVSQSVQDLMYQARTLGCQLESGLYKGNESKGQDELLKIFAEARDLKKKL